MQRLLFFCLAFISLSSSAQTTLSLDDCMRYAANHAYTTARAERNVAQARIDYSGAILRHLPSLSANVGAGSGFGRGIDPLTNTYANTTSFSNNYSLGVSLPIFHAGYYMNSTLNAKLALALSKSELEKTRDDLSLEVMSGYIDAVYTDRLVRLTEGRIEKLTADLRLAERKEDLGVASMGDVAQFQSDLAAEKLALINRKNAQRTALLKLKEVMNFSINDTLVIDTALVVNIEISQEVARVENIDHLPQVEILSMRLKSYRYRLSMARSGYFPSISASAGISTSYNEMLAGGAEARDNFGKQLSDNLGQSVSIGMSIPIFSALSARNNVRSAKIAYAQAESDYDEQMRSLRIEIEQAVMDLESLISQTEAALASVQASQIAYKTAQSKYSKGMVNVMDLQNSSNQLLLAQVELISSRLKYEMKSRLVGYYLGEALIK